MVSRRVHFVVSQSPMDVDGDGSKKVRLRVEIDFLLRL